MAEVPYTAEEFAAVLQRHTNESEVSYIDDAAAELLTIPGDLMDAVISQAKDELNINEYE